MTTLRLPGPDATDDEPERAAGDGSSSHGLRSGWGDAGERAGRRWIALVWAVVFAALLLQDFGRMTFDTKLGVNIDPVGFYQRLWHLWNPLEWFGGLQDQYIGYAFPMGAYYLAAHLLHLPVWLAERLWISLLITVAFGGLVRLAETLGIGTRPTRLLAAAIFALWPTFTILAGSTSAAILPGVLAPWAVLPLARSRTAPAAAARSAAVVLCMGGVNAVCTLAALLLPAMFILTRPPGRRRRLAVCWSVALPLACSWWLLPLFYQGRYGFNFLPYIEQAANTIQTMSAAAVLRGSGNWVAYLSFGQPWLSAGSTMIGSVWAVAAGSMAAAVGLAGLARRDLPEGTWLRWTAGVTACCALAGYGGPLGGLFHGQVDTLLDGPLSPLRNVYKVEPVLAVVLTLAMAHVLARRPNSAPAMSRIATPAARRVTAIIAAVVLAGLGLPYLSGQALQPGSFSQVPSYWRQTADFLQAHAPAETALVVPADSHGQYTWGQPIDEPLEPLARSPWAQRDLVPFSGGGVRDLLDGAEHAIETGAPAPGLAAYLDRAGVAFVVVRNDLDPTQLGYTPPPLVHSTLQESGFTRVAAFGPPMIGGYLGNGTALQSEAIMPQYPAVEIFQATSPASRPTSPADVLPTAGTTLVDGGPASLLQLEGQGRLGDSPAIIAGRSTDSAVPATSQEVTDGLRRSDTVFGLPGHNTSFTYTATEVNPSDDAHGAAGKPPRQLLPAATNGHQTVAVITGAADVTASSAGSWLWEMPQDDPVNAFDADSATAWVEGRAGTAVGQWLQIDFAHARRLTGPLQIRLLDDIPRPVATRLVVTTATGRSMTDTQVTGAAQPLNVPPGISGWMRITIAATQGGTPGGPGAGISDVAVPGVRVNRFLQAAQDFNGPTPSFSFHRDAGDALGLPGAAPEPRLDRTFATSAPESLRMSAVATAVPGAALNALLDRLGHGPAARLRVSADSTFGSLPALRPQNVLDGSDATGWVAATADAALHLRWNGRRRVDDIQLTAGVYGIAAAPTRVRITGLDGTRELDVPPGGDLRFAPLLTDRLDLSFPGVMPVAAYNPFAGAAQQLPVGIAELRIPALAGLPTGVPDPSTRFALRCGQGPPVTLDGHTYATAAFGTVADLTQLKPLTLRPCTAKATLTVPAGRHWLSSPGTGVALGITDLSLTLPGQRRSAAAARELQIGSWGAEHRTVRIGPGSSSYLEVHQAVNSGWTATLGGHRLSPITLDGWQQAFEIPAGPGGTVTLRFAPAAGYHWLLIGSAVAVIVVVAAAAASWRRDRRRSTPTRPFGDRAEPMAAKGGGLRRRLAIAAAAALLAVVGGPLVLAVPVIAVFGHRWPSRIPSLAFTATVVAGAFALTGLHHGAEPGVGAFGWPAQAAALIGLAAALTPVGVPDQGGHATQPENDR